jgi:hypothetical protein
MDVAGEYDVLVSSGAKTLTSETAILTVLEDIRITRDLTPMVGIVPDKNGEVEVLPKTVTLSVEASGAAGNFTYLWKKNESTVGVEQPNGPTLTVAATNVREEYSVEVTASVETSTGPEPLKKTSATVPVQLLPKVTVDQSPVAMTVIAGGTAVLSATVFAFVLAVFTTIIWIRDERFVFSGHVEI